MAALCVQQKNRRGLMRGMADGRRVWAGEPTVMPRGGWSQHGSGDPNPDPWWAAGTQAERVLLPLLRAGEVTLRGSLV